MKLSECNFGRVVYSKEFGVGMISGLTNNIPTASALERREVDRAIALVKWSSGEEFGIHPSNLELYKG